MPSHKKTMQDALERADRGDIRGALELLAHLDPGFVGKRLRHYMRYGGDRASAAGQLHDRLFPQSPAQPPETAGDSAASEAPQTPGPPPTSLRLEEPEPFLRWVSTSVEGGTPLALSSLSIAQVWGLTGLAAVAQPSRVSRPQVIVGGGGGSARFAHALGLDRLLGGRAPGGQGEPGRTVPLTQIRKYADIDPAAGKLAQS